MGKNDLPLGSLNLDQLKKYAEDLATIYKSEKQKRKELKATNQQLMKFADDLSKAFSELKSAHQELQEAYLDTIHRLVRAAEYKDEDTGDHIVRMSRYSSLLAEKLGLSAKEVQDILYATPMHDIGKIGIPDNILMKPGKLSAEEFEIMKTHTIIGAEILADSKAELLQLDYPADGIRVVDLSHVDVLRSHAGDPIELLPHIPGLHQARDDGTIVDRLDLLLGRAALGRSHDDHRGLLQVPGPLQGGDDVGRRPVGVHAAIV